MDDPFVGKKKSSAELLKETIEDLKECQDVKFLIEIFRHGSKEECEAACEIIIRLPLTKYTHLIEARKDQSETVRAWIAITIARSGDSFFLPQLADMLSDSSAKVRETVHEALNGVFSVLLEDKNRAKHEFENGILSDTLIRMLKGKSHSGKESAYAFLQEILDEAGLVEFLKRECDKAKGRGRSILMPYLERATRDLRLLSCGISNQERIELKEKGLVLRNVPDRASRNGRRKALAN